ncbi:MAG: hypothetical protein AAF692_08420 [Pseudomonadota bacterium]
MSERYSDRMLGSHGREAQPKPKVHYVREGNRLIPIEETKPSSASEGD